MFRYLKNFTAALMILGVSSVSFAQDDNQPKAKEVVIVDESKSTKVSDAAPIIKKEILQVGDFEIVVSSYQNNGVKTIIVTRNRNGSFYDRTEWVGKGEVPDELNWLMGKGEPGSSQKVKEKSYFGVMVKDAVQADGGYGVVVQEVVKSGPAFKSGIRKGDRITSVGGKKVTNTKEFATALTENKANTKVSCRYYRGRSLSIEKVTLEKLPKGTGLNLKSIDGGEIIDTRAVKRPTAKSKTKVSSGPKLMPTKSNMSLTGFNAIKTAGGWLNVSFSAPEVPITIIVFDGKGKEVFHQHLPWFKGNYKQLIKIKPGVEGPFSLIAAQGSSVYSKEIK